MKVKLKMQLNSDIVKSARLKLTYIIQGENERNESDFTTICYYQKVVGYGPHPLMGCMSRCTIGILLIRYCLFTTSRKLYKQQIPNVIQIYILISSTYIATVAKSIISTKLYELTYRIVRFCRLFLYWR